MKQYKVVRVKLPVEEICSGKYEKLENIMNDMAKEGWEVVCQSPQPGPDTYNMLVTFCKKMDD